MTTDALESSAPLPRIAIIEDHPDIREELQFYLEAKGHTTWCVPSAEAFWRELHGKPVDIVLVDIGLPGEDGFSVLQYLRGLGGYGLIVISARGSRQDYLRGLDLGADFYLVKPVNFADMAQAVSQLWERLQTLQEEQAAAANRCSWRLEGAQLFSPEGIAIRLSVQEARLLEALLRHRNALCGKALLHDLLFGHQEVPDMHRVNVVLSRLRHKAQREGVVLPIRTLFGKGMVFVEDEVLSAAALRV